MVFDCPPKTVQVSYRYFGDGCSPIFEGGNAPITPRSTGCGRRLDSVIWVVPSPPPNIGVQINPRNWPSYCVKLHLRHKQTNRQMDRETRPFLFVVSVRVVHPILVDEARCFIEISGGGEGVKIREQPINSVMAYVSYQENH